ncbi:MAG: hypothetical protein IRY99_00445 [Isosphaeraceae bacterium]|nr:hypothetical protein [Isosphaeraceae bacterium]
MILFAHHVAVELFGREFAPRTPLEHACAFGMTGLILGLAVYGGWTLAARARAYVRSHWVDELIKR